MEDTVDPGIVSLFGSRTRAATLGALANASGAMTAYRVARITGAQPIKVSAELRRLNEGGFIARATTESGRKGWVLTDPSLRAFLRPRVRFVWLNDWNGGVEGNIRKRGSIPSLNIDLSGYTPNPRGISNRDEFTRPVEKDRILASAGLPQSRKKRTGK